MVSGAVDMLYEALANGEEDKKIPLIEDFWNEFREHEDDVDALMEIYEEVDAELDKLDDAEFDSYEQGCCEDCSVPCDVHEEDDIDDDIKPYPVLYNARGYKSREEWVVKKRKVFDEVDIPIEEIRVEQSQTDLIIDPRAFKRLTLEIVQDFREGGYHFEDGALEALQTAAEAHLIQNFEQASARAVKANRTYIGIADMKSTV
jgi:histone H3/H4